MVGACGGSTASTAGSTTTTTTTATSTTTTVPTVSYPGRLLLHIKGAPDTVVELTSGSPDPAELAGISPTGSEYRAVSLDGTRFVFKTSDEGLKMFGALNDSVFGAPDSAIGLTVSPDGTQVAALANVNRTCNDVIVSNVATQARQIVLQAPSATYGGASQGACGGMGTVVWIDSTTLLVTHFAGPMPDTVSCSSQKCTSPPADTYSIVTTSGEVIGSMPASLSDGHADNPVAVRGGNTVVLSNGTWFDLDQMRAGSATPTPLPTGAEVNSLSPDGSKIVVVGSSGLELADLRTGATQQLGTQGDPDPNSAVSSSVYGDNVVWSPDGMYFAMLGRPVHGSVNVVVVPASSAKGGIAGTVHAAATVELIAWAT